MNSRFVIFALALAASWALPLLNLSVEETISISPSLTEVKDLDFHDSTLYLVNNKDGKVHVLDGRNYVITGVNLNLTHVVVGEINNRTYIIYTTPSLIVRNNPVRKEAPSIGEVRSLEILNGSIFVADAYGKVKRFTKDLELEKVAGSFEDRWPYIDSAVVEEGLVFLKDVNGSTRLEFFNQQLEKEKECEFNATQVAYLEPYIFLLNEGNISALSLDCEVLATSETNATLIEGDGDVLVLLQGNEAIVVGDVSFSEIVEEEEPIVEVPEEKNETPAQNETKKEEIPITIEEKEPENDFAGILYVLMGVAAVLLVAVLWVATHMDGKGPRRPSRKPSSHTRKRR